MTDTPTPTHPLLEAMIETTHNSTAAELEARRQAIIHRMTHEFKGYNDPQVPMAMLQELAVLTSTLRRRNAGPPKARSATLRKPAATLDDIL